MKPRRSKRLSKSPASKEQEDSDFELSEKKPKLEPLTRLSIQSVDSGSDSKEHNSNLNGNDSDSSASSVDYLKSPKTLDLSSDFFKVDFKRKETSNSTHNEKLNSKEERLSESEDECDQANKQDHEYIPIPFTLSQPDQSTKTNGRERGCKRSKKLKTNNYGKGKVSSKGKTKKGSIDVKSENENIDDLNISELLAIGETQCSSVFKTEKQTSASEEELSDWEEVKSEEGREVKEEKHRFPEGGVEITVDAPDLYHKRKKKEFDWAVFLKRKVNQAKREQQILIHKVHLLCWIAHGLYVNLSLNSQELLGLSLSLIPSQHCYPNKVDQIYLKNIAKWFHQSMPIVEIKTTEKTPFVSLLESLQQQFASGCAHSHRDLVFMFVCLLRSLGLTVRLIISLQPLPLKPSGSELCEIQAKKTQPKTKKVEKKVQKKVLSPEEARNLNKRVISKEEAIKRLKSSELDAKVKLSKPKKQKIEKDEKLEDTKSRRFRPRVNLENKYKDPSSSDDEINASTPNIKLATEKGKRISSEKQSVDKQCDRSLDRKSTKKCAANRTNNRKEDESCKKETEKDSKRISSKKCKEILKVKSSKESKSSLASKLISHKPQEETFSNGKAQKGVEKVTGITKPQNSKNCSKNGSENKLSPVKGKIPNTSTPTSEEEFEPLPQNLNKTKVSTKSSQVKPKSNACRSRNKSESESDFEMELSTKKKHGKEKSNASSDVDRRILSTESDDSGECERKYGNDFWVEVFVDSEKWIPVDVVTPEIDCAAKLYKRATKPITYIVAWNPDLTLKDVTRKYCTEFHSVTRKQRVDENWWRETIHPFVTPNTALDKKEDEEMQKKIQELPLPSSIATYKNHPLYVLKRHLLKFQAIYPPDAPTLGFVRGEPVYARECVYTLHSREIWLKEAKVVRLGEQPYKIVKARPKWDRMSGKVITDMPLEIFGPWQLEDYVPPTAQDGKVPRNAYGNVELFKPSMLPKGTVHLQVPGLNRVAKKLQIDCAPAVVGFDFHCGSSHPMYDGFVVCEEFQDVLLDAWNRDQEEAEKREEERIEKRVYGNWKRLIKGLLIRERLKAKYAFGEPEASTSKNKKGKQVKQATKKSKGKEEESE